MKKRKIFILLAVILLVTAIIGTVGCHRQTPGYYYPQGGMMDGGGMTGPGGIMGRGGMMGLGMMGPGGPYRSGGQRINIDRAIEIVESYLSQRNDPDLEVEEIMEFEFNFYVEFAEKSTGIHAFEALIDPYTGDLYPEPGPNMMWNTKYGMMSGMMWGATEHLCPYDFDRRASKTIRATVY
jgi:hypothetical protein